MKHTRIIIFELNEVPFRVFDDFITSNPKTNFAKLKSHGAKFTAYTPDKIHLHPKICWVTFHRGVNDEQHGILEYNTDTSNLDSQYPRFWDILRAEGFTIGIGASIDSWPIPKNRENISFYLPDMFAPNNETIPPTLSTFQRFNTRAIAMSGKVVRQRLPIKEAISFCSSLLSLGIRAETIATILKQLVLERLDQKTIVRRRTIQGLLTFDIVAKCISNTKPDLATFFSNHVASSMHRYWAAAYPDDYEVNYFDSDWIQAYRDEISFAMSHADVMLGRIMRMAKEYNYTLLLVTGMGQGPTSAEPVFDQLSLSEPKSLFGMIGIAENDWNQLGGMVPSIIFSSLTMKNLK